MNKNEFAKASETPKKRSAWVIAGMTALTVGASIVGPEVVDEIQNETGNNEPRSSVKVKKSASPITKIGDILFDTRSASADAVNTVTDANGGNHEYNVTANQVASNFITSNDAGKSAISSTGAATLTQGAGGSVQGGVAFNKQLDMTADWDMTFSLNLTKYNTGGDGGSDSHTRGAGDALGMVLMPGVKPSAVGNSGAQGEGLGIGTVGDTKGVPNAIMWGIDFWSNTAQGDPTALENPTEGTKASLLNLYNGTPGENGTQVAGFRTTDSTGSLVKVTDQSKYVAFTADTAASTMGFTGTNEPDSDTAMGISGTFTAKYTYSNGVGTLTIKSANGGTYSATQTININDSNSIMSLGFKGADGQQYSKKGVTIQSFNLGLPTSKATVNYKDVSGNAISSQPSTSIESNVGDTLSIVESGGTTNPTGTSHTFDAPAISGYKYLSTTYGTSNTTGSLTMDSTESNNVINLKYAKLSKITTVFVDQNGKVISTVPSVQLGADGTNYDGQKAADASNYADYTNALNNSASLGYTGEVAGVYSDSTLTTKLGVDLSSVNFGSSDKTVYVQLTPAAQTATISYTQPDGLNDAGKTALSTAISGSATSLTGVRTGLIQRTRLRCRMALRRRLPLVMELF